ncbi:calcium-binding protein [Lutimaribacter marinistellae]|uniref:Calcium-binding protein n=1 Tax=Lutimaribacter marinistellae TaxID=1820329 RepID=A0ABV7TE00_9RHOB
MSDLLLLDQKFAPLQYPGTAGEPYDRHVLPDGRLLVLKTVFPSDYYSSPYPLLKLMGADGSLISETRIETDFSFPGSSVEAGLLVSPGGTVLIYTRDGDTGTVAVSAIGPDGQPGPRSTLQGNFDSYNFIRLQARDDGGLLAIWNVTASEGGQETHFQRFNPDGTAANVAAILTGEDAFSLSGIGITPLGDGRSLLFRPGEEPLIHIIGPGGYPGPAIPVFDGAERVEGLTGILPLPEGGFALFAVVPNDNFAFDLVMQKIGPAGGIAGQPMELLEINPFSASVIALDVTDDGSLAVIVGVGRAEVIRRIFDFEGAPVSTDTIYSATPEEAGVARGSEDPVNEFAATVRPDDGLIIVGPRAGPEDNSILFLQSFDSEGRAESTPMPFEGPAAWFNSIGFSGNENGDLWIGWQSQVDGPTLTAYKVFTPRELTPGADSETLSAPEAVDALAGDDLISGSDGQDRILAGEGNDTVSAADGDDLFSGGSGDDMLTGGPGDDMAFFSGRWQDYAFAADGSGLRVTGGPGTAAEQDGSDLLMEVEHLVFANRTDAATTFLDEFEQTLTGTDADDLFETGLGSSILRGEAGNDTLNAGGGADTVNGGSGDDDITGGPETGDLRDVIYAGSGNDRASGGGGNDLIFGQDGNDTLDGGLGADEIQGQSGNDVITGGGLSDLIFGGDGDDFINGGFGYDRINGGDGADRFFHLGIADHGSDWVQDYDAAEGDALVFGQAATADQFQVNLAHTATPDGERSGDDDVQEAFVIYRPTGQIMWALVDGEGQSSINLQISGEVFDLLA